MKATITSHPLRRLGLAALSLLLALALVAASLPAAALAAPLEATCARNYTVQSGDTLSKIADTYNLTTAELATANNLTSPYTLFVGQVLCIPGTATTTTTSSSTTTASTSSKDISAEFKANSVTLKFSNLTKNGNYVVKAQEVERKSTSWIKIGRFKANKKGAATATLKLPKSLRDETYIKFCAKNVKSDTVKCARFRR